MKIEINVGKTQHGQIVMVVARREGPSDPWVFEVVKMPCGQFDDKVTLFALPADVLKAIGKAAADVEHLQL